MSIRLFKQSTVAYLFVKQSIVVYLLKKTVHTRKKEKIPATQPQYSPARHCSRDTVCRCDTRWCRWHGWRRWWSGGMAKWWWNGGTATWIETLKHILPFSEDKIHSYDEIETILLENGLK